MPITHSNGRPGKLAWRNCNALARQATLNIPVVVVVVVGDVDVGQPPPATRRLDRTNRPGWHLFCLSRCFLFLVRSAPSPCWWPECVACEQTSGSSTEAARQTSTQDDHLKRLAKFASRAPKQSSDVCLSVCLLEQTQMLLNCIKMIDF